VRRARWAAAGPFVVLGLVFPTYFVRVPTLRTAFGLSDGQLGLLLMLPALAGLIAMQLAGRLVARFGSGAVVRGATAVLPAAMLGIPLAPTPVALAAVLVLFGAVDGFVDVGMNVHAVAVERALGRPIMSSCHAAFSVTAVVSTVGGGVALRASTSLTGHVALVAAAALPIALVSGRHLLPWSAERAGSGGAGGSGAVPAAPAAPVVAASRRVRRRDGWTPRVLRLGALATAVMVCEGAVGSWSGIFLHDEIGASWAAASLGYVGFNVCHAGGRLLGDRLTSRFGPGALVRAGGAAGALGLAVVVAGRGLPVVVAGFTLLGLGLSVLLPVLLSVAGHAAHDAAAAIADVGTLTYTGVLLGPVLVGASAQAIGLTATFGAVLVLLLLALAAGVGATRPDGDP